jgi:hypothetical protein
MRVGSALATGLERPPLRLEIGARLNARGASRGKTHDRR